MSDHSDWRRVRFGDVVRQVKERVDPQSSELARYIAGEHMDTDDLRIRRWGEITDDYLGPAFHMRFRRGQVLYGSRRTYLRKVAVPDFEGICANTTFVLEPMDPTDLLPDMLPFIMQTEAFHDHSIKQSKGSVNPYVNFSDLAWYEFALPPVEEQRRIAELLSASWNSVEQHLLSEVALSSCEIAFLNESVRELQRTMHMAPLANLLSGIPESGCSAPPSTKYSGHWVLALNALSSFGYVEGQLKPVEPTSEMRAALLTSGDLLISRSNTRERVGFVGIYNGEYDGSVSFPDTMMRIRPNLELISGQFLEMLLQSSPIRQKIMTIAAGTSASMKKINRQTLLGIRLPLVEQHEQEAMLENRKFLRFQRTTLAARGRQASKLHRQLLQTTLGQ